MKENELYFNDASIVRVLAIRENKALIIDCVRRIMPQWEDISSFAGWKIGTQELLCKFTNMEVPEIDSLCPESRKKAYERYTIIAPILQLLPDERKKREMISTIATNEKISKQTVRKYLCLYLTFQDIAILSPKDKEGDTCLSKDEKNIGKFPFCYWSYKR